MKLLARIQGGHQVNSVDALYKQLVLEKPETYDKADLVIAHFDDLAKTHAAMQTAALKVETLKAIPDLHSAMIAAKHEREAIDTFRIHSDDPTPFSLWKLLTERRMLDDAVLANRSAHKVANDAFRSSSANEKDLKLRLDQNRDDQRSNGGEALERIEQRMRDLKVGLERATDDLSLFSSRVEPLKRLPVQNEQDFITMANDAKDFLHTFADQDKEITTQLDATKHQAWTLQNKRQDLAAEHESLRGRTTKLHRRYLEARAQIAERTGMDVSDLPFVAELIDIHSAARALATRCRTSHARHRHHDAVAARGQ